MGDLTQASHVLSLLGVLPREPIHVNVESASVTRSWPPSLDTPSTDLDRAALRPSSARSPIRTGPVLVSQPSWPVAPARHARCRFHARMRHNARSRRGRFTTCRRTWATPTSRPR
jgi:hypothetical protein